MRQICLDTETTGFDADKGDRLVEIGCVEIDGRRFTLDEKFLYHTLINPERDVPEEVVKIHGLSNERLADEPKFAEIADKFLAFVSGAELIIHNAAFDVGFLNMELKRLGKKPIEAYVHRVTDTLEMAKRLHPGQRNSLDALADRYGIDRTDRTLHGALIDAKILAEVYIALTRGQGSLGIADIGEQEAGRPLQPLPDMSLLKVVPASEEELALHEAQLDKIDKACKGTCVWRAQPEPEGEEKQA